MQTEGNTDIRVENSPSNPHGEFTQMLGSEGTETVQLRQIIENQKAVIEELRAAALAKEAEITQLRRDPQLVPEALKSGEPEESILVRGIEVAWKPEAGTCTFRGLSAALLWIDTTLAELMAGFAAMVGPERFALALQAEGRRSVESDWMLVSRYLGFPDGFVALALTMKIAGWGDWQLRSVDYERKQCQFRVANNWEGLTQRTLGVCWGSGLVAGKLAGICSKLFGTNCWAFQTQFVAKGAAFDEFTVSPSPRNVEAEIDALLVVDRATGADLAVAVRKLQRTEMSLREQIAENAVFQATLRQLNHELEQRVATRTREIAAVNEELKRSETRFRQLFEESAEAILLIEGSRFVDCNRAALEMLRLESVEEIQDVPPEALSPEYQPDGRRSEEKAAALIALAYERGSHLFEWEHVRSNGEHFLVEVLLTPIRNTDRRLLHVVWRDITSRKRAEEAATRLADIVASANDAIWSQSLNGVVTSWNAGAARLLSYSAEEIIGQSVQVLLPNPAEGDVPDFSDELSSRAGVSQLEVQLLKKDGSLAEVSLTLSPLRDHADRAIGMSAIARDISEQKRMERLLQARLRIQAAANSMTLDGLLRSTLDEIEDLTRSTIGFFHFFDAQEDALSLQMWSTNTLENMCTAEGKGSHYPISRAGVWADAVRERKPLIHNDYAALPHRRGMPTGHAMVTRELVVPILRGSKVVAVVGVGNKRADYDETDIHAAQLLGDTSWEMVERKRLELRRQRLLDELSRSNTDLEQFAYVASHDLKAPLRAIDSLAVWLEEDLDQVLTESSREHLQLLRQRTERMERLLEDLLTYSRASRVPADIASIDARALVLQAVELVNLPAGFEVGLPNPDFVLLTAVTPLRQVLTNLIANAIKHHDRTSGQVQISLDEAGEMLNFSVADDGPGIPVEFHERVFGMFQTLRPRDEVEGSGIGLALVKRIVTRYGGDVRIESRVPRGIEIRFSWPKVIETYVGDES